MGLICRNVKNNMNYPVASFPCIFERNCITALSEVRKIYKLNVGFYFPLVEIIIFGTPLKLLDSYS